MSLPALRLAYFPSWPGWRGVQRGLAPQLKGRVIVLPAELSQAERDEIIDALALLLGWPVYPYGEVESLLLARREHGAIHVLPAEDQGAPEPLPGHIIVMERARDASSRRIDLPHEVIVLRNGVIESLGLRFSGHPAGRMVGWLSSVADSPTTALRFMDGALGVLRSRPQAGPGEICAGGMARAVGWLLHGVDVPVAQWVAALACGAADPERMVGTEAAVLGRRQGLVGALDLGLLHEIPEEEDGRIAFRQPLQVLAALERAPGAPTLSMVTERLRGQVHPEVLVVLERLAESRQGLGLSFPDPPQPFVGRQEELIRLQRWLSPADRIRICLIVASVGMGKSGLAARLCELMKEEVEPIWLTFQDGPVAAWSRIASVLGVGLNLTEAHTLEPQGVPRWVRWTHDRLRERRCLVVVDDVEAVEQGELVRWLPGGRGRCAVLVLARGTVAALQRERDALVVHLPPLSPDEAREILTQRSPRAAAAFAEGRIASLPESMSASPLSAVLMSAAIEQQDPVAVLKQLTGLLGGGPITLEWTWIKEVADATARQPELVRRVMRALAVCAAWSSLELVRAVMEPGIDALTSTQTEAWLGSLSSVPGIRRNGRLIGLDQPLKGAIGLSEGHDLMDGLRKAHAQQVLRLWVASEGQGDWILQDDLYDDLLLAARRMDKLIGKDKGLREDALAIAWELRRYPRGDHVENSRTGLRLTEAVILQTDEKQEQTLFARAQYNRCATLLGMPGRRISGGLPILVNEVEQMLKGLSHEDAPREWAMMQSGLSSALLRLRDGERRDVLSRALAAAESSVAAFEQIRDTGEWRDWFIAQTYVAAALIQIQEEGLGVGDEGHRAVELLDGLLGQRKQFIGPHDTWTAQITLAYALRCTQDEARRAALERGEAIAAGVAAQVPRGHNPQLWANAQLCHGALLMALAELAEKPGEALARAIECFWQALTVFTEDTSAEQWAETQARLGRTLAALPEGDQRENLRRAIDACQSALKVYTQDTHPIEHARVSATLEDALTRLQPQIPLP